PEFPRGYRWLNTAHPLGLHDDLGGHVVLLHFWTSCSINCLHVLPTLSFLEHQFADRPLAVVGVHTGKFTAEHDPDHVTAAVQQHGIRHPVLVDRDMSVWRAYGVRSWPTLVLVDGAGKIRFQGAGEPDRDRLVAAVGVLLDAAEGWAEVGKEATVPEPPPTPTEQTPPLRLAGLRFPSKLAIDSDRNLLWIADTGNHRVVAVHLDTGEADKVVGAGLPGAADGALDTACFCQPRGIATDLREIYVADSGNHLLRRINLEDGSVDTVLGRGKQVVNFVAGRTGSDQGLNSPWALCMHGDDIVIAMAGSHQLWKVNKDTMTAAVLAGRGGASLQDARPLGASLAQPSGVSCSPDQGLIAFADSETSAVRIAKVGRDWVATLVGKSLFDFGDEDGVLTAARLQHPEDVAFLGNDVLFVADTFNHKVKRIDLDANDPAERSITTILGADARLRGPEGLAVHAAQNLLFVADTHNHRILQVDLADGSWSELEITGLPPGRTAFGTEYLRARPVLLASMADVTLAIPIDMPDGARLHPDAPMTLRLENIAGHPLLVDMTLTPCLDGDTAIAENISTAEESDGVVRLRLSYMTCHEMDHVCHVHEIRRELPVRLAEGGQLEAHVAVT
ncbi:MAG: redoxin family protein, partial [Planctomycetota bacterium]